MTILFEGGPMTGKRREVPASTQKWVVTVHRGAGRTTEMLYRRTPYQLRSGEVLFCWEGP